MNLKDAFQPRMTPAQLMPQPNPGVRAARIAGWSNLQPATCNLQPRKYSALAAFLALCSGLGLAGLPALAAVQRETFVANGNTLTVEMLDDDLAHFELAPGPGAGATQPILVSPMIFKTNYTGPTVYSKNGATLETADMRVEVNPFTLVVTVTDKTRTPALTLTSLSPLNLSQPRKGLTISREAFHHVYGLGEQFITAGSSEGDWVGRARTGGNAHGNAMVGWNGGAVGNCQFPVAYFVGDQHACYALFLDDNYRQEWSFVGSPWKLESGGAALRWYIMTGPDLPDLRKDYLELVGHPLVPPRKAFGLWVSEYGFDNWAELESKLLTLRSNKFPVDGFVLDLQWFGGVTPGSDDSRMGTLDWDLARFPNPAAKIAQLAANEGIGLILIEESYVSKNLPEHAQLAQAGYLVRQQAGGQPVYLTANSWWGKGGMIDWSNEQGADYWHDAKRQALIQAGVLGHWTDLGEPEMYDPSGWYDGFAPFGLHDHASIHNLYNFAWHESIHRGYARNGVQRRPLMLSRSGAPGIQRFGAAMWSGDIGGNLSSLATHCNAQLHMSFSGMDYFGADIGGFHRGALSGDLNEMFTQWFANGAMFDVPVRTHTENLCNCKETAPDRIGNPASNLENIRLRYELAPYYYSLAHRAHLLGEPVVPPLAYYYQDDPNVGGMGHEKLIGRDLLVAIVAAHGETMRDVYLPAGTWINYHSREFVVSTNQWIRNLPEYTSGKFKLPVFARAGAILPKMFVDDKTMNILGKRTDGSIRDELIARVFSDPTPSQFVLYEDDGESIAYLSGQVRTTEISQQLAGNVASVTIQPATGSYQGAPQDRRNMVELVADRAVATGVTLNGSALAQQTSRAGFDTASSGWFNAGNNLIVAKSDRLGIGVAKAFQFTLSRAPSSNASLKFVVQNGHTVWAESVYVVGNIPQLGNWDAAKGVKLDPVQYPRWEGTIAGLPPDTDIEWKAIKRWESGGAPNQWEPGANNKVRTPAPGQTATTEGDLAAP
jgi:alpha-glucosidase